jgi:hypothetical protein
VTAYAVGSFIAAFADGGAMIVKTAFLDAASAQ